MTGGATVDLSVVIPAYNEEHRIPETIRHVVEFLEARDGRNELIVVDDGSADNTSAAVRSLDRRGVAIEVIRHARNRGKGAAVRTGVGASRGSVVLFSDADLSTPIADAERLFAALAGGVDIAIGSRAVDRRQVELRQPWHREAMGRVFNRMVQALLLPGIHDTQCGFKAFRGDAARELFGAVRSEGFEFDVEVLYRARRRGMSIQEVAVRWRNSTDSRISAVSDSARMLAGLFRIRRMVDREG